jgi:hypothetical protein
MGPVWQECVDYANGVPGTQVERRIRAARYAKAKTLAKVIDDKLDVVCLESGLDRASLDMRAVVLGLPEGARRDAERKAGLRPKRNATNGEAASSTTWGIVAEILEERAKVDAAVEVLFDLATKAAAR